MQMKVSERFSPSGSRAGLENNRSHRLMDHNHYSPDYIQRILQSVKTIAMVGASAKEVRPSNLVMKYLIGKGYSVIPVNPGQTGKEILGQRVYATLKDVPVAIDMVDIFKNSVAAGAVVEEAIKLDPLPKVIWMQLTVRNDEAARKAEEKGIQVVMNRCPKIEYGKYSGEWGWVGGASGVLSSRRLRLHESGKVQSLGLAPRFKP
jgi:predicted CoA-binding protein